MNSFEKWYETYERHGEELMLFNTIDLEAAYNAGLDRAAEIANGYVGCDAIVEKIGREKDGIR